MSDDVNSDFIESPLNNYIQHMLSIPFYFAFQERDHIVLFALRSFSHSRNLGRQNEPSNG